MRAQSRLIRGMLATAAALLIHAAPASAAAPAECYADNGVLVVPQPTSALPGHYDWTLTLNFNHSLNNKTARGCYAIRMVGVTAVQFVVTKCPILNNAGGISIGNGQAEFDGNIVISCSLANVVNQHFGASALYEKFSVHSTLQFKRMGKATLARTKQMSVVASANESGHLDATSMYGNAQIHDLDQSVRIFGRWIALDSVLLSAKSINGYHIMNGVDLPAQPGAPFFLDHTDSIQIGAVGDQFILDQLIIDPGTRCCRPS